MSQKGQKTHPRTLIGSGKVAELKQISAAEQAEGVVFINELSGIQLRNLSQELALSVIDRSALILEIFEQRARHSSSAAAGGRRLGWPISCRVWFSVRSMPISSRAAVSATAEPGKRAWNARGGQSKNKSGIFMRSLNSCSFNSLSKAGNAAAAD